MDEVVILDEVFVRMTYCQKLKMLKVVWRGTVGTEQYQQTLTFGMEYQEKNQVPIENYLSDIRRQGVVNPESRKWFEQVAIPRSIKQGLKRAAVVFDGNAFKRYYLNMILQTTNIYRFPLKFFDSKDEAIKWFASFDK